MNFLKTYPLPIAAMTLIVLASNIAVQYPIFAQVGPLQLADVLTYGAFVYPFAFLVTDLTNRRYGARIARRVVFSGFAVAVACSILVPPLLFKAGLLAFETEPGRLVRIAIASGSAFLAAQSLDIFVFDKLRGTRWWRAPVASSLSGSILDTTVFFSIAFATIFVFVGPNDGFALESGPLFGVLAIEAPRWVSWALGDLTVKLTIAVCALLPYRLAMQVVRPMRQVAA